MKPGEVYKLRNVYILILDAPTGWFKFKALPDGDIVWRTWFSLFDFKPVLIVKNYKAK